jgi:hypothetical protein
VACVWRAAAPKWTAIVATGPLIMEGTRLYFSITPKIIIGVETRGPATLHVDGARKKFQVYAQRKLYHHKEKEGKEGKEGKEKKREERKEE